MTPRILLRFATALLLVVSAAVFLIAADIASPHPADVTVQAADLTVHEWGTFTSVAGEDGSAIEWDALGCKDDLPGFVNDFGYRGFKWRVRGTVRMETPVMYFYSPREIDAHVKVAFPQGLITEWYPQATHEVYQMVSGGHGSPRRLETNLNGIDTSLRGVTGAIEWNHVKVQPNTTPALPIESGPSRYYAARETDAAPITVGDQHEKFLFYRGVGRFPVPLSARLSVDGTVLVENHGHDAVPSIILFENRGGRVGYRNAGAIEEAMTLDPPPLDDAFPQLRYDLENALVEQGLFLKEAQAMVQTWRDSWFEEGTRLIYIMSSRAVDAILPLRVDPAPSQIARVFVGRIELVTPDTTRTVEEALARSDWSTIDRHRRFLEPILRRIERGGPESANQAERLLRHLNQSIGARACR
jgi:hypothetical protein